MEKIDSNDPFEFWQSIEREASAPKDLYRECDGKFICPKCKQVLVGGMFSFSNLRFSLHLIQTKCRACRPSIYVRLPELLKKTIYLDQSTLCDLYKASVGYAPKEKPQEAEQLRFELHRRLLKKINLLRYDQKLSVIVSELHAFETAGMKENIESEPQAPEERDFLERGAIWKFACSLTDDKIFGDREEAFIFEVLRFLKQSPVNDVENDANSFLENASCRFYLFPSCRSTVNENTYRWHDPEQEQKELWNDAFKKILENQMQDARPNSTYKHCLAQVTQTNIDDIVQGIDYLVATQNYQAELKLFQNQFGDGPFLNEPTTPLEICNLLVFQLRKVITTGGLNFARLADLKRELLTKQFSSFPTLQLSVAIEAQLLLRWVESEGNTLNKFNGKFGVSRMFDVGHLSVYVPRVNVLITDKNMLNTCQNEPFIRNLLEQHPCKIFGSNKLEEFERWLDNETAQPQTKEVQMACRMLRFRDYPD